MKTVTSKHGNTIVVLYEEKAYTLGYLAENSISSKFASIEQHVLLDDFSEYLVNSILKMYSNDKTQLYFLVNVEFVRSILKLNADFYQFYSETSNNNSKLARKINIYRLNNCALITSVLDFLLSFFNKEIAGVNSDKDFIEKNLDKSIETILKMKQLCANNKSDRDSELFAASISARYQKIFGALQSAFPEIDKYLAEKIPASDLQSSKDPRQSDAEIIKISNLLNPQDDFPIASQPTLFSNGRGKRKNPESGRDSALKTTKINTEIPNELFTEVDAVIKEGWALLDPPRGVNADFINLWYEFVSGQVIPVTEKLSPMLTTTSPAYIASRFYALSCSINYAIRLSMKSGGDLVISKAKSRLKKEFKKIVKGSEGEKEKVLSRTDMGIYRTRLRNFKILSQFGESQSSLMPK